MRCVLSVCLKFGLILGGALMLATQVFAAVHAQHPLMPAPAMRLGGLAFYAPWQGVQWARWWLRTNPELFLWAGVAFGGVILVMTSIWLAAALKRFQQTKTEGATLATDAQLRQAKLLRKDGIVVGKRS